MVDKENKKFDYEDGSQERATSGESDNGMRIFSYLLAGIICYGGLGWFLDSRFDTVWMTPVGVVFGLACSIYLILKKYSR